MTNKINANCREGPTSITPYDTPVSNVGVTETSIQVNATFIDSNLQPTKRIKTEEISSEIVIDDDEFL